MEGKNESLLTGYPKVITYECSKKIIKQMEQNICKIKIGQEQGTGFFCKIPFPNKNNMLPVLITNNHVIDHKSLYNEDTKIKIDIEEEKEAKIIDLRDRIKYTSEKYDITIIELKEKDNINNYLDLDDCIMNDILDNIDKTQKLVDKTIYIIQYPKGELSASYGVLTGIYNDKNYSFIHKSSTDEGSSGSPVLNLNNKVIGLHKKTEVKRYNEGTFLNYPLKEFIQLNYNKNQNENNDNINNKEKNEFLIPESNKEYNIEIIETKINELDFQNNDIYSKKHSKFKKIKSNALLYIGDLIIFEDKLNEIIVILNNNSHYMNNECFDLLNFYYNCSFYGKLETLFQTEKEQIIIELSLKYLLISVIICYDFCFEIDAIYNNFSFLIDILNLNHLNIIIIYEYILNEINSETSNNFWIFELRKLVTYFNNFYKNNDYILNEKNIINTIEKIQYNISNINKNIKSLFKYSKYGENDYLNTLIRNIEKLTYEEIKTFYGDFILRVDNENRSILASIFLKNNQNLKTEPFPYIHIKNIKQFSLILDLNETLIYFKSNKNPDIGTIKIRPFFESFLELVGKFYELIIFTAGTQDYTDDIIDGLENNKIYFDHRLYRQHTIIKDGNFIKDLTRVGRPLDKTIIVDNMPQNFIFQRENGILIKSFHGEDNNDNALEELGKILINIAKEGGDVRISLKKYRDEIIKKVSSNISKRNYEV